MPQVWGLDFGDCHKSFLAHGDSVMAVAFLSRTHYFFSAGKDRAIKYWDADRFEHILTLEGHKGEVWGLAAAPDGAFVVSASHDRSLRVWVRTDEQASGPRGCPSCPSSTHARSTALYCSGAPAPTPALRCAPFARSSWTRSASESSTGCWRASCGTRTTAPRQPRSVERTPSGRSGPAASLCPPVWTPSPPPSRSPAQRPQGTRRRPSLRAPRTTRCRRRTGCSSPSPWPSRRRLAGQSTRTTTPPPWRQARRTRLASSRRLPATRACSA